MKKNVLALLLAAFMLIGLLVVGAPNAQAEETAVHENHCVCGGAAVGVHDHECATIEWQPLPEGTTNLSTLATGNYYLTGDVTLSASGHILSGKTVSICLNGHNISGTSKKVRVLGYTDPGSVVNFCDCSGVKDEAGNWSWGGTATGYTTNYGAIAYTYSTSAINLYGGNFTNSAATAKNAAVFLMANDNCADWNNNQTANEEADKRYAEAASTLNVYNGRIYYEGTVSGSGGLIGYFHSPKVNIHGGILEGANAATGAAICVMNNGVLTITGGTIKGGNTSGIGGNIYANNLVISGGTIAEGISAAEGGNVYANNLTISGGKIADGTATKTGGNIYAKNLTINGGEIIGGTSTSDGGNIYANVAEISGGSISGGSAANNGGNIYASNLTITDGSIGAGTAANNGGNIWGTNITMSGGSIFGGKCTKNRTAVLNTSNAYTYTGGDAINTGVGGNVYVSGDGYLNMTGGKIYNGIINGNTGGNIFVFGGEASTTITGGHIWGGQVNADNSVKGTADLVNTWYVLGGSIYFRDGTNTIGGDVVIGIDDQGNAAGGTVTAGGEGGNISAGGTLYIKGNAVIANGFANTDGSGKGGNLTCNGATVYIQENAVIKDGVANYGGNITLYDNGNTYISGGIISGGAAPNGGNIIVDGGDDTADVLTISGGTIKDGCANNGGNILLQDSVKVINITGGTISGGRASNNGGNIYTSGKMTITDCKITDGIASNTSKKDSRGGNIYVNACTVEISGGTISGGQATHGGNLDLNNKSVVTITNCAISDGVANLQCDEKKVGNGGNIHAEYGSNLTITGGSLTGGDALRGGSLAAFSTVNITGCSISGGYATYAGGNVFVFNMGNVTMDSTTTVFDGTSGVDGGNFIVTSGGTVTLNGTTVSGGKADTADGFGGSIIVEGQSSDKTRASSMTINNCAITGGDAKYGGSVAVKVNGVCTISGSTVETSTGSTGRVAYIADGGTLTVKDSSLNNTTTVSAKNGTCIWNCGTLVLQGTVKLSDSADEDVTYQTMDIMVDARNGADATIDVSGLTGQDAPYGIRRWEIDATDDDCGLLATGATEAHEAMFYAWRDGYEISYADGCLYLAPNAVQIMNGINVINGYATLDEAMADTAEATHYVLYASMDGQTISKDILLDLNGKHLTNVTVNEGVTVQLYDTANNGFDASACGSLSGTVNGTVQVMTRSQDGDYAYVVVCEDGVYSAHRFYRALHAISLDPSADALGYKATFNCDDVLSKYVVDYGFQLWVGDGSVKSYGKSEFVSGNLTLRLKNILAAGGGEMEISGRAYIIFEVDGEQYSSIGSTTTTTMKDTVEAVNTAYAADNTVYSAAQMSAVQALLTKYADATSGWAVADILAWSAPATDDSTEA